MLTITLDNTIEQRLNFLTHATHSTIEQVIANALELYEEQQEDSECLAIIAQRQNEKTVSYEDVLARLRADGII